MGSRGAVIVLAAMVVAAWATSASADLIYTTGPTQGNSGATPVIGPLSQAIAESFSLSSPATLTDASVGLWVYEGFPPPTPHNTPISLTWAIGTSPRATDVGTATVTLTNTYLSSWNGEAWDIYESSFAISCDLLAGQTYWFSIASAASTNGASTQWDIVGSSTVPTSLQWTGDWFYPLSFTLNGVPEPACLTLLACAFGLVRPSRRHKAIRGDERR